MPIRIKGATDSRVGKIASALGALAMSMHGSVTAPAARDGRLLPRPAGVNVALRGQSSVPVGRNGKLATSIGAILASFRGTLPGVLPLGTLAIVGGIPVPERLPIVLPITGALPLTAAATCRFKKSADSTWTTGHPLHRVRPAFSNTPAFGSVLDCFAWPIIDVEPGTLYDVEVTVTSGASSAVKTLTTTTRALPAASGAANKFITVGMSQSAAQAVINGLVPGDVCEIQGNRTLSSAFTIGVAGTTNNPIYIRGQTRATTLTAVAPATTGKAFSFQTGSSNLVIENLTLAGDGVKDGNYEIPIFASDTVTGLSRITLRSITATGFNNGFVFDCDATGCLAYDCTLDGNGQWIAADLDNSSRWFADGIRMPGIGNSIFNVTLTAFGDPISFSGHSGDDTLNRCDSIHFYRIDVRNANDDTCEIDHANLCCSLIDSRAHNAMTFTSLDPLYGGPFLHARNYGINIGRLAHKWNDKNTGFYEYCNTVIGTQTSGAVSLWYQPAGNGAQDAYAYRNNIMIDLAASTIDMPRIGSDGNTVVDWTHNDWFHPAGSRIQWEVESPALFTSPANAAANIRTTTPMHSGVTKRFTNDGLTTANPWTDNIAAALGADYHSEVIGTYLPRLAPGSSGKNTGVVIPNITDGYTGAFPDRGAIIEGRADVVYGDRSLTPAYIAAMTANQVAAMSGPLAPTNGNGTVRSVTPSAWQTVGAGHDPGNVGLPSIVQSYCGAPKAIAGTVCFVHGGGHADSANDGIYGMDFAGGSKPTGMVLEDISTPAAVQIGALYSDGRAQSVHTYDGCVYAHHNNTIYRFGGAQWHPSGGFTNSCVKFPRSTGGPWAVLPNPPVAVTFSPSTIYDPVTRKILVGFNAGGFECAFFRCDNDTWSASKNTGSAFWPGHATGAWDSFRGRGVVVGSGESVLVTVDFVNETVSLTTLAATGATALLSVTGPSIVYDRRKDCFWIFGGPQGSPGWSNLYQMNGATLNITSTPFTGVTTIPVESGLILSSGRFLYREDWRAICIVTGVDLPAHVIKLPN